MCFTEFLSATQYNTMFANSKLDLLGGQDINLEDHESYF